MRKNNKQVGFDQIHTGRFPNKPQLRRVSVEELSHYVCWTETELVNQAEEWELGLPATLDVVLPRARASLSYSELSYLVSAPCWYVKPKEVVHWWLADALQGIIQLEHPTANPELQDAIRKTRKFLCGRSSRRTQKRTRDRVAGLLKNRHIPDFEYVVTRACARAAYCFRAYDSQMALDTLSSLYELAVDSFGDLRVNPFLRLEFILRGGRQR